MGLMARLGNRGNRKTRLFLESEEHIITEYDAENPEADFAMGEGGWIATGPNGTLLRQRGPQTALRGVIRFPYSTRYDIPLIRLPKAWLAGYDASGGGVNGQAFVLGARHNSSFSRQAFAMCTMYLDEGVWEGGSPGLWFGGGIGNASGSSDPLGPGSVGDFLYLFLDTFTPIDIPNLA